MFFKRSVVSYRFGTVAALVAFFGAAVFAQQTDEEPAAGIEESNEVEEIVVVGQKPGDRRRVDQEYEDPVRAKLLKDLYTMKVEEEEYEWRKAGAVDSPSRIKWGYDPRDDYQMRNRIDIEDENWGKTRPASLFRMEFGD